MKKSIFLSVILFVLAFTINAQHDTMYVMKAGVVVGQYNVNTEVDSVIFYKPIIEETTSGAFMDTRDSTVYNWITIGNQVWMVENLRYLPSVVGPGTGSNTSPYYYVYGYEGTDVNAAKATENYQTYGVLYNWQAALNACPAGWHLPTDAEWTELINYLGGESVAGGKLKETGTAHWISPNTGATNETGFTALPGGIRFFGSFVDIGEGGYWWSATEYNTSNAWEMYLLYNYSGAYRSYYHMKEYGFSVRCVRNY